MTENTPPKQAAWPADIAKLSFEDAMAELEKIVRQLEDGKAKLEDAMGAYERGTMLRLYCEAKLREAEARIEQISVGPDGALAVSPASI